MRTFTIPIEPKTKKNNQRILTNKKTGRPFVMPSKQFCDYEKDAITYIPIRPTPLNQPLNIKCLFYMGTHRRVDLTNLLEAIDDILVNSHYIEDDNSRIIVSHDGSRVLYDKENPRTEIYITESEDDM